MRKSKVLSWEIWLGMVPPVAVLIISLMFIGGESVLDHDVSRGLFPFLMIGALILPFVNFIIFLIKLFDDERKLVPAILLGLNTLVCVCVGYFAYLTAWV